MIATYATDFGDILRDCSSPPSPTESLLNQLAASVMVSRAENRRDVQRAFDHPETVRMQMLDTDVPCETTLESCFKFGRLDLSLRWFALILTGEPVCWVPGKEPEA